MKTEAEAVRIRSGDLVVYDSISSCTFNLFFDSFVSPFSFFGFWFLDTEF